MRSQGLVNRGVGRRVAVAVTLGWVWACAGHAMTVCGVDEPFAPAELSAPHQLKNVFRVGERFWSGSEPVEEQDFAALAAAGVKTIVSVDSVAPNVELARRHGIRYVHLPIGYDQVDGKTQLALARVAREIQGPVYVHCHHGKHRGPAAAAALCRLSGEFDAMSAKRYMEAAGTGRQYGGLWRSVEELQIPGSEVELPELVERAETEPFAEAMARLEQAWREHEALAGQDDPARDGARLSNATLLLEGLVESRRVLASDADASLREEFERAIAEAKSLVEAARVPEVEEQAQRAERLETWRRRGEAVQRRCASCHEAHRG